jgi:hypothetical protein
MDHGRYTLLALKSVYDDSRLPGVVLWFHLLVLEITEILKMLTSHGETATCSHIHSFGS